MQWANRMQAELGNAESRLRTERQSNSDLRSEVRRAAAATGHDSPILPPVLGGPTAETIMLHDEVLHPSLPTSDGHRAAVR